MKTRLYKKYVKQVCKNLSYSKKQLFSKDGLIMPFMIYHHEYDFAAKKFVKDNDHVNVVSQPQILSKLWNTLDLKTGYLHAYWKHSHWKPYVQVRLDIGEKLEDILKCIVKLRKVSL